LSGIDVQLGMSAVFLSAMRWLAGPEWHPRPHSHPFCEIIVPLRGTERANVDGMALHCETGHVLFYPPGKIHAEWQHGSALLEFYCVEFEWADCPREMPLLLQDRQGRVLELARWLESENFVRYQGEQEYRQMVLRTLVGELLRLVVNPSQEIVERVRRFVNEHLSEPLALDDLAAECRLNKFHLVRTFRALTGLTPMEYVRLVRLDTARHFILSTSLPLKDIAPRVGLADEYHLSRLLKSRYGRGAREMRKQAGVSEPHEDSGAIQ